MTAHTDFHPARASPTFLSELFYKSDRKSGTGPEDSAGFLNKKWRDPASCPAS